MCIIAAMVKGVKLPKENFMACWNNNPDGAGFAYLNNKREIVIEKELNSSSALYWKYVDAFNKNPNTHFLLHFRIGTQGVKDESNLHPFKVDDNLVFVHNGIFSEFRGSRTDPRSDTSILNDEIFKKMPKGFEANEGFQELLDILCGGYNKLAFLNKQGQIVIINSEKGTYDKDMPGCWFSNSGYKASDYYDVGGKKIKKQGFRQHQMEY